MHLLTSFTSPYARKVRAVIREKGLVDRVEDVACNPWSDPEDLFVRNPIGRVPVLITDDGFSISESALIVDYLDQSFDGPKLIPASGIERWRVLGAEALADGILDASIAVFLERKQPASEQRSQSIERNLDKVRRAIQRMEEDFHLLPDELNLGHIASAVALEYVAFRLPDLEWQDKHPKLAELVRPISERPSMVQTRPPES